MPKLTVVNVLTLPCPKDRERVFYPDAKVPGLALCVFRSGTRRWYLKKKRNGQPIRLKIDDARVLTLPQARDRAQKMLGEMSNGVDVVAERRAVKIRGITTEEALRGYIADHVNLKPRSKSDYETVLKRHAG